MATAQTYRRQFKKTFEIVDKVATEYYQLLEEEKIGEDDNFICTYSDIELIRKIVRSYILALLMKNNLKYLFLSKLQKSSSYY